MPKKTADFTAQLDASTGRLTVIKDEGTVTAADGSGATLPQITAWEVNRSNVGQHLPMFDAYLSPGDRSAARDIAAAEAKKRA